MHNIQNIKPCSLLIHNKDKHLPILIKSDVILVPDYVGHPAIYYILAVFTAKHLHNIIYLNITHIEIYDKYIKHRFSFMMQSA